MKFKFPFKISRDFDWIMLISVIILVCLGVAIIYSTTYTDPENKNLAFYQGLYALIGGVAAYILAKIDYRAIKSYFLILYIIGIILLLTVLILGKTVFGATRWINLGFFQLQPSEIFKLILILFLARILSDRTNEFNIRKLIMIIVLVIVPVVLVLLEPDLGTALVIFAVMIGMIVAAGVRKIYLLGLGIIAVAISPLTWFLLRDYQRQRILTFLNPSSDPFGAGYNILQSIIAVGSGQFIGRGLGHGSQSQLNFLPIKHSDFIFAVFAEELGFIGAVILILLFVVLLIRIIRIAKVASDDFGMLVASGICIMFIFQILVNIGMNIGIMPVTGIPLPFVSYGGTSLIVNLGAVGILFSIILRHRKLVF
jgi:rod shape determining protein RodA